jgi:hypothetical protein
LLLLLAHRSEATSYSQAILSSHLELSHPIPMLMKNGHTPTTKL